MKARSAIPIAAPPAEPDGDLPEGWREAPLLAILHSLQSGFACGNKDVHGGVPHLRMNNVATDCQLDLTLVRTVPKGAADPKYDLRAGDILVCTTNSSKLVGKCALFAMEDRFVFSNHLTRLRPLASVVDSRFLTWTLWLRWRSGAFSDKCRNWVNQSTLPKEALLETHIPIPPLAEQKRIVAKVEELLARVNAAREWLAKVPAILKRFRQSVLAAACSGRLTEDWRTAISVFENADTTDAVDLSEIPASWKWTRLGSLGADPRNPIQTGPFGAQLHRNEFVEKGVPVVAVGNLTGMGFTHDGLHFITETKAQQLARYSVNAGDVLFARSGATLGKVCVAPPDARDWRMTGHILRARLNNRTVLPQMAVYALRGDPSVLNQVHAGVRGATRPGYNTALLESICIQLPPLPEQREVVRRVERLFAMADAIDKQVAAGTARVEKLTQAILAKAFRGGLVPTEADLARRDGRDYEPAAALLERIRGGSEGAPGEHPTKGGLSAQTRRARAPSKEAKR